MGSLVSKMVLHRISADTCTCTPSIEFDSNVLQRKSFIKQTKMDKTFILAENLFVMGRNDFEVKKNCR